MYHHAESPEVIHAKLAEWERTVTAHRAEREAERLLADNASPSSSSPIRSLVERLQQLLHPAPNLHEQRGH